MVKLYDLSDEEQFDADKDSNPFDALKKLQNDYERNDVGRRENLCRLIQRAATTCERLKENGEDIERFIKDKFWNEKPYQPKAN